MSVMEILSKLTHIPAMMVTLRTAFKPPITVQYPEEHDEMKSRFRGRQVLEIKKCISCGMCARSCPNKTIVLEDAYEKEVQVKDGVLKKVIKHPSIYLGRCIFCGYCVEGCPTNALTWSQEFELAEYSRKETFWPWWKLAGLEAPPANPGGEE